MRVIAGTVNRAPPRVDAEFPAAGDREPPDWLVDPEAVNAWRDWRAMLMAARALTAADEVGLAHLANLHARLVLAWRIGATPRATDIAQLRLFLSDFGFTPATRGRVNALPKADVPNPFQELAARPTAT